MQNLKLNYKAIMNKTNLTLMTGAIALGLLHLTGCGTNKSAAKKDDFFTSGSREADQRASQRMAKDEQLSGSSAGEKHTKKAVAGGTAEEGSESSTNGQAARVEGKLPLFDRLGGETGISAIIEDFTPRALQDPRVNWQRTGVKSVFSFHKNETNDWTATSANTAELKKHLVQFIALATGGPVHYDGKDLKTAHAGMKISNPEFDAALGDLKASLDRLQIPNKEQKELLAVVESTRPLIVTQR